MKTYRLFATVKSIWIIILVNSLFQKDTSDSIKFCSNIAVNEDIYGLQECTDVWTGGIICPSTAAQLLAGSNHMYSPFNQSMTNQSVTIISLQASSVFQQIHN